MQTNRFVNELKLADVCSQYEINLAFANFLRRIINYKVVIIADDSGSMNTPTDNNEPRWNELCRFIQTTFLLSQVVENNPLDVYFLNRPSILGVHSMESISEAFRLRPNGGTPIVPILEYVLRQPYYGYEGRIIIIATDGEPTDQSGHVNIRQLKDTLLNKRSVTDYVTFLACTDDEHAVGYLNKWDKQIPRVDVSDDFISEKKEVLKVQGEDFSFTYAHYIVKTVLGCVIPELDNLDEIPYHINSDGVLIPKRLIGSMNKHKDHGCRCIIS